MGSLMKSTRPHMSLTRAHGAPVNDAAAKACTAARANCFQVPQRMSARPRLFPTWCLSVFVLASARFPRSPFYGHGFLSCITPNKSTEGLSFIVLLCCPDCMFCSADVCPERQAVTARPITPLTLSLSAPSPAAQRTFIISTCGC